MSVKNGAELLDRLMKDIVADAAATYVSIYNHDDEDHTRRDKDSTPLDGESAATSGEAPKDKDKEKDKDSKDKDKDAESVAHAQVEVPSQHIDIDRTTTHSLDLDDRRAFSLERFIPLLQERVYAISPYTRMHLVSWLMVLNTVPDLELVSYLPEFLDGIL
jgi:vacuole morphology and inheritance protein 14